MNKKLASILGILFGLIFAGNARRGAQPYGKPLYLAGNTIQIILLIVLLISGFLIFYNDKLSSSRAKVINFLIFIVSGAVAMTLVFYGQKYLYSIF